MGLLFAIAASPRQCSCSQVQVPRDLWPHFTVSDSRLPQPGGPCPCIYIPQEQSGPVIPPGTGFSFHCLLRLADLWWRYSTSPPHGIIIAWFSFTTYQVFDIGPHRKHCVQQLFCCCGNVFTESLPSNNLGKCLLSHCLAIAWEHVCQAVA
jgi:hypothetical protein